VRPAAPVGVDNRCKVRVTTGWPLVGKTWKCRGILSALRKVLENILVNENCLTSCLGLRQCLIGCFVTQFQWTFLLTKRFWTFSNDVCSALVALIKISAAKSQGNIGEFHTVRGYWSPCEEESLELFADVSSVTFFIQYITWFAFKFNMLRACGWECPKWTLEKVRNAKLLTSARKGEYDVESLAIVEMNVLQSLASLDIRRHLLWRLKQTVLCGYVNYSFVHFTNIFYVCVCFSPYFQFWELYGTVQICLLLLLLLFFVSIVCCCVCTIAPTVSPLRSYSLGLLKHWLYSACNSGLVC